MISGMISQGAPVYSMPYANWGIYPIQMLGSGVILVSGASGILSGMPTYSTELQICNNSGSLYFGNSGLVMSGTSPVILSGQNLIFKVDMPSKIFLVGFSGVTLNVLVSDY